MPFPSTLRAALLLAPLLLVSCATPPRAQTPANALDRWRAHFPALMETVSAADLAFSLHESADSPLPAPDALPAGPDLALFTVHPGETFVLPPVHGPETPFPDHHPLRQLAGLRTVQARLALAAGDTPAALALIRQNLAQARATLRAQEGIIPLIHAVGVWQSALDGVHALALSPALPPGEARALLAELQADSGLAQIAAARALHGEYDHVYRVIVERMPVTDDPDLLLSAVGSLGMDTPEPLPPGALGLGLTDHRLLDPAATLAAYRADLAPYLAALAAEARLPRHLYPATTAVTLAGYQRELGAFTAYAAGEGPTTLALVMEARASLESTPNPVGKLLAIYLTPPWEVMIGTALRREAQRAALCGLLAWRIHGSPTNWETLVAAGLLPAAPADPFAPEPAPLRLSTGPDARIWSVYLNAIDDGGGPVPGNEGQPPDLVWAW